MEKLLDLVIFMQFLPYIMGLIIIILLIIIACKKR